jgi:hypothetical protein
VRTKDERGGLERKWRGLKVNVGGVKLSYNTKMNVIRKNVARFFVMIFSGIHRTVCCVQDCSLYMSA